MSEATHTVTGHHIPQHLHVHNSAWTWGMIIKNNVFNGCSELRTQEDMDSFRFGFSEKSCFETIFIKITYRCPLTPKLNPSVQHCLTRFFLLGILLLEPCISLTHA
jgi:hypothetical protein